MSVLNRAVTTAAMCCVTTLAMTSPARAEVLPVGVNGCTAQSNGNYQSGTCTAIVTAGWYSLTVSSSDWAQADLGCSPSGSTVSTNGAVYFYLTDGYCSLLVWGVATSHGTLAKY
jgi:hypothetical protein